MKTLLIAVLILPLLGLLPPKPALVAPAEPDPRTEAGSAAQPRSIPSGREAMLDQLSTAADDSRAILANLEALDPAELASLQDPADTVLQHSRLVVIKVEILATQFST